MEQLNEQKINKIIDNFNKDFETKIKSGNTKFLKNMYNNFICLLETETTIDKYIMEELDVIEQEVDKTFDTNEKALFARWTNAHERLISLIEEQAFIYGFCTNKALENETFLKGSDTNEK